MNHVTRALSSRVAPCAPIDDAFVAGAAMGSAPLCLRILQLAALHDEGRVTPSLGRDGMGRTRSASTAGDQITTVLTGFN